LKPLVARHQGTYALGKFNICQNPEPCSGIIAAFCELCAKFLALQERQGLWYQELDNGLLSGD
jgi:hypothetical protein